MSLVGEVLEMTGDRERSKQWDTIAALIAIAICLAIASGSGIAGQQDSSQSNPCVQIISPQNGATFVKETIIPITYQAWSPDGTPLIRAEAYVNGIRGDEGLTYNPPTTSVQETLEWDATFFKDGPHTITIRVFDARNRMGEASVTIYKGADTTKPRAEILSPQSGSVIKGKVVIIAKFEDDRQLAQVGVRAISQAQRRKHYILYARGGGLRERVYEATVIWDTTATADGSPMFPDGLYILQAWAVDGQGLEGTSPEVLITVHNQVAEAVIQRPETGPRAGHRQLAQPAYGTVIIARSSQPGTAGLSPRQPIPGITIKPAPIPEIPRQMPNVELSMARRLELSEGLQRMLAVPVVRVESITRGALGQVKPLIAGLSTSPRGEPLHEISQRPSLVKELVSGLIEREGAGQIRLGQVEPLIAGLSTTLMGKPPVGVETPRLIRDICAGLRDSETKRVRVFEPSPASFKLQIATPIFVARELAIVSHSGMLSSPIKTGIGRGVVAESGVRVAQPVSTTLSYAVRPTVTMPVSQLSMAALMPERAFGTLSKPIKPTQSLMAYVELMGLPLTTYSVFPVEVGASKIGRAPSAGLSELSIPKPRVASPIPGANLIEARPLPSKPDEPSVVCKGEISQVCSASVCKAPPITTRARESSIPVAVQPTPYGIPSVALLRAPSPVAGSSPRCAAVLSKPREQTPFAIPPSYARAQVVRTRAESPAQSSPNRIKMVEVAVPSYKPPVVAIPGGHRQLIGKQPAVVIARQRTSFTYTVQQGDTLCGLARKFGLTLHELMKFNNLGEPIKLRAGQTLTIPRMPISVRYNGRPVNSDVQPYLLAGTALTPFRAIIEFAGGMVDWMSNDKKAVAQWDGKHVCVRISDPIALINGAQLRLKPSPFLLLNRMIVPARLFEHIFEVPVVWNPQDGAVEIGIALKEARAHSKQSEHPSSKSSQE